MSLVTSQTKQTQAPFSVAVKGLLLVRGWTVKDLAKALGYSRNNVSLAIHHPEAAPTMAGRIREWMAQEAERGLA